GVARPLRKVGALTVARREGRAAGGEVTDRKAQVDVAGRVAALADEVAHDSLRVAVRPGSRVVGANLGRTRLVRLAEKRPPLVERLGTWPGGERVGEEPLDGVGRLFDPLRSVDREDRSAVFCRFALDEARQGREEPPRA